MPKSKYAPALFELLSNRGDEKPSKLAVPRWFKSAAPAPSAPPRETADHAPAPAAPPRPAPVRTVATPPPTQAAARAAVIAPDRPAETRPPILRIHAGRLEVSLNPVNALVTSGVLVLALLCAFLIGQGVGAKSRPAVQAAAPPVADPLEQALNRPANGTVLDPHVTALIGSRSAPGPKEPTPATGAKPEKTPAPPPAAPAETPTAPGLNRVVVESFKADHARSAEHVRDWLASSYGLNTELRRAGDRIWLVTTGGFDLDKPGQREARDKLIEDLKSLGDACARELTARNLPVYRLTGPYTRRFDN